MMLQEAGEAEERQTELLEVELDRLRGPHTGAQLAEKQQQRLINKQTTAR